MKFFTVIYRCEGFDDLDVMEVSFIAQVDGSQRELEKAAKIVIARDVFLSIGLNSFEVEVLGIFSGRNLVPTAMMILN